MSIEKPEIKIVGSEVAGESKETLMARIEERIKGVQNELETILADLRKMRPAEEKEEAKV